MADKTEAEKALTILQGEYIQLKTSTDERIKELEGKLNTPQFAEFNEAVKCEMAHHLGKWGDESSKPSSHFTMVLGYLLGKLIKSFWDMDAKKFEHHLITLAAVCGTAHKYFKMRGSMLYSRFNKK